jgi:hypothetical protein
MLGDFQNKLAELLGKYWSFDSSKAWQVAQELQPRCSAFCLLTYVSSCTTNVLNSNLLKTLRDGNQASVD